MSGEWPIRHRARMTAFWMTRANECARGRNSSVAAPAPNSSGNTATALAASA